jgi:hypothetical protein
MLRMTVRRRLGSMRGGALIAAIITPLLAACVSEQQGGSLAPVAASREPAIVDGPVAPFPSEDLVGSWGTASYQKVEDRARVEDQARAQCRLPYRIAKGPTDGVMMYFADDPKLYELKVKAAPDGKVYVGFEGPPGGWQDREVLLHSRDKIIMKFVDADIHARYGTFVFMRCKGGSNA